MILIRESERQKIILETKLKFSKNNVQTSESENRYNKFSNHNNKDKNNTYFFLDVYILNNMIPN